jgi:(S)-citramalyl-CoA lyase
MCGLIPMRWRCKSRVAAWLRRVHRRCIKAIDAPCFAIHDAELLQADLAFAVANGFHGKAAIHPSHIPSINRAFTPSADRVAWAKRVLEANEQGAAIVDGRMVDEAIAREARGVLAAA